MSAPHQANKQPDVYTGRSGGPPGRLEKAEQTHTSPWLLAPASHSLLTTPRPSGSSFHGSSPSSHSGPPFSNSPHGLCPADTRMDPLAQSMTLSGPHTSTSSQSLWTQAD